MQIYANHGGDSGVRAYEIGNGYIIVEFTTGACYEYTNASAGPDHIVAMHGLARKGVGLNSYINRNVRKLYSRKIS